MREVGFASAYAFKYSPRPGTPAADLDDQVDEEVKAERLAELFTRCSKRSAWPSTARSSAAGSTSLFDKPGRHAGQIVGRSPYMQSVHAEGDAVADRRHGERRNRRRQCRIR